MASAHAIIQNEDEWRFEYLNHLVSIRHYFSGIRFIDSMGFEVLMNIHKTSKENNSDLNFINLSEDLMELMELVELDKVFQLN